MSQNHDRLSKYRCLDDFGTAIVESSVQKTTRRARVAAVVRRSKVPALAALALAGGSGVAGVAIASETGSDEPAAPYEPALVVPSSDGYQKAIDAGLSIPVITVTDRDGNYVYGPYNCKAHTDWFVANIAEKWMNGLYADASEFPKPPDGICG